MEIISALSTVILKVSKAARKLSYEAVINDLDNIMDEYYKYLEILKYGIYKSPQT